MNLTPEFIELWNKIKPRTTYHIEFKTDELVARAVNEIKYKMQQIETPPKVVIRVGQVDVKKGGVTTIAQSVSQNTVDNGSRPMPDILAYLQEQTELTRATLVRILEESEGLSEFFLDPQKFMDQVSYYIKNELRRLLVNGINPKKWS